MGVDYTAYAVIGVPVNKDFFDTSENIRGCGSIRQQNCPDTVTTKFCPECGKVPTQTVETGTIDDFDFPVGIDYAQRDYQDDIVYVGFVMRNGYDSMKMYQIPQHTQIAKLKETLTELLGTKFNNEQFGIHLILHCSY